MVKELEYYLKEVENRIGGFIWRHRCNKKRKGYLYDRKFGNFIEGDKLYIKRLKQYLKDLDRNRLTDFGPLEKSVSG